MTPEEVAGRLQRLCNNYGDFKVARSWKDKDGMTLWSKHRSVMSCWESDDGIRWLGTVSHRQILPVEVVLDLDDNPTESSLNIICDFLDKHNEDYGAYFTGSRGFHIHVRKIKLALLPIRDRELFREIFINSVMGDTMKKSEVLIALEDVPHWKTGKVKTLVRSSKNWEGF